MSLRSSALLLMGGCLMLSAVACGGNADQFPIPDAGDPDPDAGADAPEPTPDGDEPEPDGPPPPPSACPVFPTVRVTDAPGHSDQPALHWNGSNYLVVWADERAGGSDIWGTWLTADGSPMAGFGQIVIADTAQQATSPEIVPLAGGGFLVVFENCSAMTATGCTMASVESVVLGADGRPGSVAPVVISPAAAEQRRPYVAAGHGNVYVTYRDRVPASGAMPARTVARLHRLDAAGAKVDPVVTLDEASDGHYPHVATSPDRVALTYQRNKPQAEIVLALLDPALTLEREVVVRAGMESKATNPVVQWNVSRWVLAWEDERESDDEPVIYATTVTAEGATVQTPEQAYENNGNWPSIASGGLNTTLVGFYGFPGQRIFLERMEATGRLKPGQVVIDDIGRFPAVIYNPQADEYAVVYQNERIDEVKFVRFKCAD
jgi:hypothetical protein